MKSDKLESQIDGQKTSKGASTFDQTAMMVPAVGVVVMVVLMFVFYVYYRRKQRRHNPVRPAKDLSKVEKPSSSGRRRGPTLAEAGGLPPVRSSGKEAAS